MHLPKISHLNAIYFKLFAIWFVLVHVALRFMLWFCWYLNWKKLRKVHGFCLFLSIYLYFVWNAYFHLCQSVQSARILYGWDPEIPLIEQNEAHNFCRSVFFCVYNQNNAETAKRTLSPICIDNDALTLSQRSHTNCQAPFCKLNTHHQMRLLLIDGFFHFNSTKCQMILFAASLLVTYYDRYAIDFLNSSFIIYFHLKSFTISKEIPNTRQIS